MNLGVRHVLFFVALCILASLCAGAGTGRPFLAALGVVAAIACVYFSLQRRRCPACGHLVISVGGASAAPYCMKCGTAYDGLNESLQQPEPLQVTVAEDLLKRRDPGDVDDNPYRAPLAEGSELPTREPRKWRIAIVCFAFAALFGVLFIGTLQTARRTLGSAVAIGWTGSTCAAFFAIAVGTLKEKKWLVVSGALAILVALAMMFSLVISFPGQ